MRTPHPLADSLVEVIADRFRVLGEPMRIRITDRLVRCRIADETVLELCEQVCGGLQRQIAALQTLLGSGAGI